MVTWFYMSRRSLGYGAGAIMLTVVALWSCSDANDLEESVKFYEQGDIAVFVERLEKHGIQYRMGSDGSVFYKVKDREIVKRVVREVRAHGNQSTAFSFEDSDSKEKFSSLLMDQGINFKDLIVDGRHVIIVDQQDSSEANSIYKNMATSE